MNMVVRDAIHQVGVSVLITISEHTMPNYVAITCGWCELNTGLFCGSLKSSYTVYSLYPDFILSSVEQVIISAKSKSQK